jgi:hypothetical protein
LVAALRTSLRGPVVGRGDPDYERARRVWNGLVDRHPAYPHRAAGFNVSIDGSWHDPVHDEATVRWVRTTWAALTPFATGGIYLDFAGLGEDEGLRAPRSGRTKPPWRRFAAPTTPTACSEPPRTDRDGRGR